MKDSDSLGDNNSVLDLYFSAPPPPENQQDIDAQSFGFQSDDTFYSKPKLPKTSLEMLLGIKAKISRSYLNHICLSILFAAYSIYMLIQILHQHGDDAKQELIQSCASLEHATNALASTPYYIAKSINRHTSLAILSLERHAVQIITFAIQLVKHVLIYILLRYQKVFVD